MEEKRLAALKVSQSFRASSRMSPKKQIDVREIRTKEPSKTGTSPPNALNSIPNLDRSRVSSFSPSSATSNFPRTPYPDAPPGLSRTNTYIKPPDMMSSVPWIPDGLDVQTCITPDSLFINEQFVSQPIQSIPSYHKRNPVQAANNIAAQPPTMKSTLPSSSNQSTASVDGSVSASARGRNSRRWVRRGRGQHTHAHVNGDLHHQGPGEEQRRTPHVATVSQLEAEIAQKDLGRHHTTSSFILAG
jgi:hypothetical protein